MVFANRRAWVSAIICDERNQIVEVNQPAAVLFGRSIKGLIGRDISQPFAIFETPPPHMVERSVHDSKLCSAEKATWYRIESFPIMSGLSRQGTLYAIRDITPLKESEQLRQSLTNMIVHDLKQPIASVQLMLQLSIFCFYNDLIFLSLDVLLKR